MRSAVIVGGTLWTKSIRVGGVPVAGLSVDVELVEALACAGIGMKGEGDV